MGVRGTVQAAGWVLIAVALLSAGAYVVYVVGRGDRPLDPGPRIASLCDLRYARARTYADTLIADRVDVGSRYRGRVLCEDYRLNRRGAFSGGPRAGR